MRETHQQKDATSLRSSAVEGMMPGERGW